MRLLVVTQTVDTTDTRLGFFHTWITQLAQHFDSIEVICLYEGAHSLPGNVHVYSLGKEKGSVSKLRYSVRFLRLVWSLRSSYDRVFVHMNQEYVLLGGLCFKLLGKKVYLWRNHYAGTVLTYFASFLSTRVFYTSKYSYTARVRNAVQMPVGVDTTLFNLNSGARNKNSILFFGRMAPSKKPDLLIDALAILHQKNIAFTTSLYGPTLVSEQAYLKSLKEHTKESGLETQVTFYDGVEHNRAPLIFGEHEIYVNLGDSGMYDKMLFEASASGCLVLALSTDFKNALVHPIEFAATSKSLASALENTLHLSEEEKERIRKEQYNLASRHTLGTLISKLASDILA